jgi:hypothetical protein
MGAEETEKEVYLKLRSIEEHAYCNQEPVENAE